MARNSVFVLFCVICCCAVQVCSQCIPDSIIQSFHIITPLNGSHIEDSVYFVRLSASVSNIPEFQNSNDDYYFCIRSFLLIDQNRVEIFNACNSVFDETALPGYSQLSSAAVQTHSLEVDFIHKTKHIICQSSAIITLSSPRIPEVIDNVEWNNVAQSKDGSFARNCGLIHNQFTFATAKRTPAKRFAALFPNSQNSGPFVINVAMGIKSAALHSELRQAIRDTWFRTLAGLRKKSSANELFGKEFSLSVNIVPFFIVGEPSQSLSAEDADCLQLEQSLFGDVLLEGDVPALDSYHTLTQKTMLFLSWAERTAAESAVNLDYFVVCDDDVYVDGHELASYLWEHSAMQRNNSLYVGEVLERRMHHVYKPMRDPAHLNYLSPAEFPMNVLPPFALGNFYALSADVVSFVTRNAGVLKPVGTLEDLSVGVWLMGLQVFPQHHSGVCDLQRCLYDETLFDAETETVTNSSGSSSNKHHTRLMAVSGLRSGEELRRLHRVISHRAALSSADWLANVREIVRRMIHGDPEGQDEREMSPLTTQSEDICFEWSDLQCGSEEDPDSSVGAVGRAVSVVVTAQSIYCLDTVHTVLQKAQILRATDTLQVFLIDADQVQQHQFPSTDDISTADIRLTQVLRRVDASRQYSALLTASDTLSLLDPENAVVLLSGVLDYVDTGVSAPSWDAQHSNSRLSTLIATLCPVVRDIVFVSGEPVDLSQLQLTDATLDAARRSSRPLHMLMLVATTDVRRLPSSVGAGVRFSAVYTPTLVTAFGEMDWAARSHSALTGEQSQQLHAPSDLLRSAAERRGSVEATDSRVDGGVVAYLYSRCDRPHREAFFDALSVVFSDTLGLPGAVVALGPCSGSHKQAATSEAVRMESRFSADYLHSAVQAYEGFRFVVAFENAQVSGYITEKLTNAYLAGCIPVYFGAPDVHRFFNPLSMVNCGDFESWAECAARVSEIHSNELLFRSMRSQVPIAGKTEEERLEVFAQLFAAHNISSLNVFGGLLSGRQ